MKVLFRSDSSKEIGLGRIKRDLIFARQYEDVSFACLDLEGSLIDEIPYRVFELKSESIYELINLIKDEQFELLIVDHHGIDANDEKLIKYETGIKILSFDDEIKAHHCDILLNINAYAKASDYEGLVPPRCEIRCGFSYALIRDEFYKESKQEREKIYDYFICLGTTDVKNLSTSLILDLPKNKRIALVTTSLNRNLDKLIHFADENSNVKLFIDPENLAKLMNESNKLIISAGSLVNEALILKANFKTICLTKSQEKIAAWLIQKGYEVEYRLDKI